MITKCSEFTDEKCIQCDGCGYWLVHDIKKENITHNMATLSFCDDKCLIKYQQALANVIARGQK